jgi:hypothetical protein
MGRERLERPTESPPEWLVDDSIDLGSHLPQQPERVGAGAGEPGVFSTRHDANLLSSVATPAMQADST